ncbi:hydrolase [Prauserella marina]|uniref:Pimeloyl-ACP methyl ester carboxylesterase n=1 Tax=Prauserella marina TaxID=530584 RepID=A0A222VPE9_9PSEU|nr:alpha/beta hydrolase [Prauserella marina]ASR35633.1 hydrolase [Prauserella marina]PWV84501.1 pimeloyl-ACP methyl ester carboxylesterase [Prauserella marina]SDC20857.1 Pimeloyl-ACP methyl ester carboxylesterase [Prauserella marina]
MLNLTDGLRRPGCVLRYADSGGAGTAAVFLHGAGIDHHVFDAQYRTVSEAGFRTVTWDLRGHGQSRPNSETFTAELALDDLAALCSELELDRPILIGHSLGGNIAQEAVRRDPSAFTGMAVVDSTWNTGPLSPVQRKLLRMAAPLLTLVPARSLPKTMANASAVTAAAREDAIRAFGQLSKREFVEVWRATTAFVAPDPGYRTAIPLCLVVGEKDKTGNIATAMRAWAAAENTPLDTVPSAGHLAPQDAPDEVSRILLRFLEEQAGPA